MRERVVYITVDIEKSLGLELYFKNLEVICRDKSPLIPLLREKGVEIFCLAEHINLSESPRSTYHLLKESIVNEKIKEYDLTKTFFQFFKYDDNLLTLADELGLQVLNNHPTLNAMFENKISQFEKFSDTNIMPQGIVCTLGEVTYVEIINQIGENPVLQFDRGHTGSGTHFIESQKQFENLQTLFKNRPCRISKNIQGDAWTINGLVLDEGSIYSGFCKQITGIKRLTAIPGATVGNDWSVVNELSESQINQLRNIFDIVSDKLHSDGYRGLFGLDLILNDTDAKLIEINARQPASTGTHSYIQHSSNEIPLIILHTTYFISKALGTPHGENLVDTLGNETSINTMLQKRSENVFNSMDASQFLIRNRSESPITSNKVQSIGIYSINGEYLRSGYNYLDIKDGNEFLFLPIDEESVIPPNGEIGRIIMHGTPLASSSNLKPELVNLINLIGQP